LKVRAPGKYDIGFRGENALDPTGFEVKEEREVAE